MPQHWLMKSEPDVYSIDDLERDGSTCWEGVRNYQARNNMQKMKKGDWVLFYHSNANPPGVAGLAKVSREAYPDHYAWKRGSKYFDAKSDEADPRWFMVDVEFHSRFAEPVGLDRIKADSALANMVLVRNSRLSVQPVERDEFRRIRALAK